MNLGIGLGVTNYLRVPTVALDPDAAIAALFESGEVGAWYDPSDLTTLYQDTKGLTAAGVGDPVGLILDKSKGLTLGSELVDTANTAAGWTAYGTNTVEQDGDAVKVTFVDNGNGAYVYLSAAGGLTQNIKNAGTFKVEFEAKATSVDGLNVQLVNNSLGSFAKPLTASYQTFSLYLQATIDPFLRFTSMSAGEVAYIRNITVKELPGNHATQTTSAARPILQQSGDLYYLDFDGVDDWLTTGAFAAGAQAKPNTISFSAHLDWSNGGQNVADSANSLSRQLVFTYTGAYPSIHDGLTLSFLDPSVGANLSVWVAEFGLLSNSLRKNAANLAPGGGSVGLHSWDGITLAARYDGANNADCNLYAYVGVNRTLTAAEITDLETYLASKSGVTI